MFMNTLETVQELNIIYMGKKLQLWRMGGLKNLFFPKNNACQSIWTVQSYVNTIIISGKQN